MYAFIEGAIAYKKDSLVVIENNGIGFNINIGNNTLSKLGSIGEICKVFTYLQVKEDGMSLFGFLSLEEKAMFEKLISISGVGCKMAIQILGGIELSSLAISIASGDVSALNKIKGIGKKTAERIILELREKVKLENTDLGTFFDSGQTAATTGAEDEAIMALVSLGFGKTEAFEAVKKVKAFAKTTEELITFALRSINK